MKKILVSVIICMVLSAGVLLLNVKASVVDDRKWTDPDIIGLTQLIPENGVYVIRSAEDLAWFADRINRPLRKLTLPLKVDNSAKQRHT